VRIVFLGFMDLLWFVFLQCLSKRPGIFAKHKVSLGGGWVSRAYLAFFWREHCLKNKRCEMLMLSAAGLACYSLYKASLHTFKKVWEPLFCFLTVKKQLSFLSVASLLCEEVMVPPFSYMIAILFHWSSSYQQCYYRAETMPGLSATSHYHF